MGIKDQFQDKAQDLAEKARSRAGGKDEARERGTQARDDMRERGTQARDEASERSSQARDTARQRREQFDEDYDI
ncbi:hypothetical protein [Streptomyces huasconensis]|uniref:hypothetical protein n=1 Tax=Streptomyces huasconensis TaxID=1854574 RepID=UPI0033DC56DA